MKKIIIGITALVLLIGGILIAKSFFGISTTPSATKEEAPLVVTGEFEIPAFSEIPFETPHTYDPDAYAFRGSALIDIDNDGVEELWLAGGKDAPEQLFGFRDGAFVDISQQANIGTESADAAGALSLDIDQDRDIDLIVGREDGVYIYTNNDGIFDKSKIDIAFAPNAVPFSLAATDLNKDGWVDLYVSTFIDAEQFQSAAFNKPENRTPNVMLRNNGDNTFTDITESSGLAFNQNTFQVAFVDLNGDTWQDLIVAPNTNEAFIYENRGDETFEKKAALNNPGFWMGLAVSDYDNDGDQDFFMSNVGDTIPERVGRGDLRDDQVLDRAWGLYRNDGDFTFSEVAKESGIDSQEFGWGAAFGDANNDGLQELVVSENYVKWPPHKVKKLPGSFFLNQDGVFGRNTSNLGLENPFFGTTPLFADFTADGYPELVYVNIDSPTRVFENDGGSNHFITLALPDTVDTIGAVVTLTFSDGTTRSQQRIVGQGLMSDFSADMIFGLGARTDVVRVDVVFTSGDVRTIDSPEIDTRITL